MFRLFVVLFAVITNATPVYFRENFSIFSVGNIFPETIGGAVIQKMRNSRT